MSEYSYHIVEHFLGAIQPRSSDSYSCTLLVSSPHSTFYIQRSTFHIQHNTTQRVRPIDYKQVRLRRPLEGQGTVAAIRSIES